jgi:histidyl-tRNA synthetase
MLSRERTGLFPDTDQNAQVFVVMASGAVKNDTETANRVSKKMIETLQIIRQPGYRVDRDLKERPLRKQMEYAASIKAHVVVIIGPLEVQTNVVSVRDMKTGEEHRVTADKNIFQQELQKYLPRPGTSTSGH